MTRFARHLLADLMRALGVLAIVFLGFAHSPLTISPSGADDVAEFAAGDLCIGHGTLPAHKGPASCTACRIASGIDLPPPPPGLSPPPPDSGDCQTLALDAPLRRSPGPELGPRGPPALA